MFKAFKMSLQTFDDYLNDNMDIDCFCEGSLIYDEQKKAVYSSLEKYLSPSGILNASKIEHDWFPSIEADVFLSHSHKDEDTVIAFAGWLEKQGIKAFIDSTVWKLADDLLKKIDHAYCVKYSGSNGGYTYDYDMRNRSTAYVHAILNGALAKMIDDTECLFFLDTPNSLKVSDISTGLTDSCWIYSELLLSKIIRKRTPPRKSESGSFNESFHHDALKMEYDVDLTHLIKLDFKEILHIQMRRLRGTDILDQLYYDKGI